MKTSTALAPFLALCLFCASSRGEPPYEKSLQTLIQQRDRAIENASAPIVARFNEEAAKLLREATRTGDLDAAIKIRTALGPAAPNDSNPPLNDPKKQLAGTLWKVEAGKPIRPGLDESITFTDKVVEPRGYKYEIQGHTITIVFTGGDRQPMTLSADGKHLKFSYAKKEYTYELVSH
jgi:hypothetical protein